MRQHQLGAVAQVTLEGAPLPAGRRDLLDYAQRQRAPLDVLEALRQIPDTSYQRIDDVGEAIVRVQPAFASPPPEPKPESGEVPGGDAYLDPSAQPGAVRGEPTILDYERQLVREPGAPGEGVPKTGEQDEKPGV